MINVLVICHDDNRDAARAAIDAACGADWGVLGPPRWRDAQGRALACAAFAIADDRAERLRGPEASTVAGLDPATGCLISTLDEVLDAPAHPIRVLIGIAPEIGLSLLGVYQETMESLHS